jgi:diguanylate cyclase (GGDEF)-like protein
MPTRALLWMSVATIAVVDALLATPIGLPLLYFVALAGAGLLLRTLEIVAMALTCAAARYAFGPVGDPLGLHEATLHLGESQQLAANAALSAAAYVATALVFRHVARQKKELRTLHGETRSDPLTRVANRRALQELLARPDVGEGTVLVVDVDHFKRINDTRGHDAGDVVLRELAARLLGSVRGDDMVARTGGEEFVLVLPGASAEIGQRVAERILRTVRTDPFAAGGGEPLAVTVSIGCASGRLEQARVTAADQALYRAKQAGRDRAVAAGD